MTLCSFIKSSKQKMNTQCFTRSMKVAIYYTPCFNDSLHTGGVTSQHLHNYTIKLLVLLFSESRSTEILIVIVVHYCYLVLMAIFSEPENVRSTGYHEPVGPCNKTTTFNTISTGKVNYARSSALFLKTLFIFI